MPVSITVIAVPMMQWPLMGTNPSCSMISTEKSAVSLIDGISSTAYETTAAWLVDKQLQGCRHFLKPSELLENCLPEEDELLRQLLGLDSLRYESQQCGSCADDFPPFRSPRGCSNYLCLYWHCAAVWQPSNAIRAMERRLPSHKQNSLQIDRTPERPPHSPEC